LRETVEVPEGDAERPLSRSALERKFMNFAVPVIGAAGAGSVMALLEGLEELKDVRELTRALRGSGKQNSG
jgi:2-methylcitrate dehydratase